MVGNCGHLGGGDAAAAVQGGEDLAEGDHLAADAGFSFHQSDLVALICQIQGGLHPSNTAANNQCIYFILFQNELLSSPKQVGCLNGNALISSLTDPIP